MGTSYEGLLVIGDLAGVADTLAAGGITAIIAEAGPQRIGVIPRADPRLHDADVSAIARLLSGTPGRPVLAHWMFDSDILHMSVSRTVSRRMATSPT